MKPTNNKIQLDIVEEKIAMIQTDAISECGTIIALGQDVPTFDFPIGSKLYFKAWAVDIITVGDKKYYFIDCNSDAICAIE